MLIKARVVLVARVDQDKKIKKIGRFNLPIFFTNLYKVLLKRKKYGIITLQKEK